MNEITIQKAAPEDAQGIGDVFYKTWLATYPNEEYGVTVDDIEFRFRDRKEKDGSRLATISDNMQFLIAKDGDQIVGVCRIMKKEKQNELIAIYVLPEYQGQGIGKMFWNESLKFFDPKQETVVKVVVYNKKAIEFYKKLGFKETDDIFFDERLTMKSGSTPPEMQMVMPALE